MLRPTRTARCSNHDCIERWRQHPFVVHIRRTQQCSEWHATAIGQDVALRPALRPVGWVRACELPPFGALTMKPSSAVDFHTIPRLRSYRRSISSNASVNTPSVVQACIRRWQVEPDPNSFGSAFHWQPARNLYSMPTSITRSGTRGRPPFGFGLSFGRSGSTPDQSSSGTVLNSRSMPEPRASSRASVQQKAVKF